MQNLTKGNELPIIIGIVVLLIVCCSSSLSCLSALGGLGYFATEQQKKTS